MIGIKPARQYCRLLMEVIFLGILLLYFIIKPLWKKVTTRSLIQSKVPPSFSTLSPGANFSRGATDFFSDGTIIFDDMIFLPDILNRNFLLHPQVNHLIIKSNFKALLASWVVNFIPKTPHSGQEKYLTMTGYSSGLTYFTYIRSD